MKLLHMEQKRTFILKQGTQLVTLEREMRRIQCGIGEFAVNAS